MYLAKILISFLLLFSSLNSGKVHSTDTEFTVYFFLLDECKICNDYGLELNQFHATYGSEKIKFVGVFPNFSSKKNNIEAFREKYGIEFELKTDYFKQLSNKFEAEVLPEVFVYDQSKQAVIYRGRIDDRYVSIAKRRRVIKQHELKDVLDNISIGKEISTSSTQAIGCLINYNDNL